MKGIVPSGLQIRVHTGKLFCNFSTQNSVVGTQKNHLIETVLLGHPKHKFKLMGKEINAILCVQTILIWTYVQHLYLPSHSIASLTSNGYFMSPSTRPGVSTKVTRLNFFCFDVEISV